ncbi:unnamed protein product [Closterium sp. NIES-65]|nr:unnamed protein product [Closterium sp. NIES-65]
MDERAASQKPIKVAVAVDGSENSIEALRAAIRMFGPTAKEIHIVHARRPFDHDFDVENTPLWQQPFQRMERQSRADSRELLGICCQMAAQETQRVRPADKSAERAGSGASCGSTNSSPDSSPGHSAESSPTSHGGRGVVVEAASMGVGGLEVKGVELRGDPRDVISNYSKYVGADMLVMGSRGNSMLKRFPMGSVSNYCMRNAACPVLIVPAPAAGPTACSVVSSLFLASGGGSGSETNIAAWLYGVEDVRLLPAPTPSELGPHDVRVRVRAVGICGSDVHYYKHMRIADYVVNSPMVLGHESAGTVLQVGSAVTRCKPGDAVAMEPGRGCLATAAACAHCAGGAGRYNLCRDMQFFATPPVHGSLANEVIHPDFLCFPLPPSVSLEEGAMCEPLSVAVHACRRALAAGPAILPLTHPSHSSVPPSSAPTTTSSSSSSTPSSPFSSEPSLAGLHVAVVGAGPIGLLVAMTARALGAAAVAVADVSRDRVAFAEEVLLGGGEGEGGGEREKGCGIRVLQMEAGATAEANAARLLEACSGTIHVTMDCVGITATMRTALHATSAGGRVVLIGMGETEPEMSLPIASAVALREVDIVGVFRYCHTYDTCVALLRDRRVNVKPLITHRFGFSQGEVEEAFRVSAGGGKAIKVMFNL